MSNATILTVDDSKLSRRTFVAKPLRDAGYEVIEAENGEEGLAAVEKHSPDCILSDLLMPVMDGFDFVQELKNRGESAPVIVLSADIQESSRGRVEELDVYAFLNKPFSRDSLLELVEKAVNGHPKDSA